MIYCQFRMLIIDYCLDMSPFRLHAPLWRVFGFVSCHECVLDYVLNVMAHAQKPDFFFRRNGRVHLNRQGRQFSRLLAAEVCASAVVMLDTPCSEVVWRVLVTHSIRQFLPSLPTPLRHRVPSHFNWTLNRDVQFKTVKPLSFRSVRVLLSI